MSKRPKPSAKPVKNKRKRRGRKQERERGNVMKCIVATVGAECYLLTWEDSNLC